MDIKQTFFDLLVKYDGNLAKTDEQDTNKIFNCFDHCRVRNINPFEIMREARSDYEISKTYPRHATRN